MSRLQGLAITTVALCVGGLIAVPDAHAISSREVKITWDRVYAPSRPVVRLVYSTGGDTPVRRAVVRESARRVSVELIAIEPEPHILSSVSACVIVRLTRPLGHRQIVDGVTHQHPNGRNVTPDIARLNLKRAPCHRVPVLRPSQSSAPRQRRTASAIRRATRALAATKGGGGRSATGSRRRWLRHERQPWKGAVIDTMSSAGC